MPRLDGIDTSRHQTIATDPPPALPRMVFAMHKLSEGRSYRDKTAPKFLSWYARERRAGRVGYLGGYHWIRSDVSADAQAANFIAAWRELDRLVGLDYAMLDWERTAGIPDPSLGQVNEWLRLVDKAIGAHRVAVYSAQWVDHFQSWRRANPDRALFYPAYTDLTGRALAVKWGADVWQYDGDEGRMPGIFTGAVDRNEVLKHGWFDRLRAGAPVGGGLDPIQPDPGDLGTGLAPITIEEDTMRWTEHDNWRWHDTRFDPGHPIAAGDTLAIAMPPGVGAVRANVTAIGQAPGFLTVAAAPPSGQTSTISYVGGQAVANEVTRHVRDGKLYVRASAGAAHVIVDIVATGNGA